MSYYIKLSTMRFPMHEGDIRLEHPEILESQTGPTFPCPDDYAIVEQVDPPVYDETQYSCSQSTPVRDENGNWKMNWIITELTEEQRQSVLQIQEMLKQETEKDVNEASSNYDRGNIVLPEGVEPPQRL